MKNTGWVILPLGWLLITVSLAVLSYMMIKRVRLRPPSETDA